MTQEFVTLRREVAEQTLDTLNTVEWSVVESCWIVDGERIDSAINTLRAALEQPQGWQEPVAWVKESCLPKVTSKMAQLWRRQLSEGLIPLYTRPHPRQPLTDEKRRDIARYYVISPEMVAAIYRDCISATERAHDIK